jgi:hypothetical protein
MAGAPIDRLESQFSTNKTSIVAYFYNDVVEGERFWRDERFKKLRKEYVGIPFLRIPRSGLTSRQCELYGVNLSPAFVVFENGLEMSRSEPAKIPELKTLLQATGPIRRRTFCSQNFMLRMLSCVGQSYIVINLHLFAVALFVHRFNPLVFLRLLLSPHTWFAHAHLLTILSAFAYLFHGMHEMEEAEVKLDKNRRAQRRSQWLPAVLLVLCAVGTVVPSSFHLFPAYVIVVSLWLITQAPFIWILIRSSSSPRLRLAARLQYVVSLLFCSTWLMQILPSLWRFQFMEFPLFGYSFWRFHLSFEFLILCDAPTAAFGLCADTASLHLYGAVFLLIVWFSGRRCISFPPAILSRALRYRQSMFGIFRGGILSAGVAWILSVVLITPILTELFQIALVGEAKSAFVFLVLVCFVSILLWTAKIFEIIYSEFPPGMTLEDALAVVTGPLSQLADTANGGTNSLTVGCTADIYYIWAARWLEETLNISVTHRQVMFRRVKMMQDLIDTVIKRLQSGVLDTSLELNISAVNALFRAAPVEDVDGNSYDLLVRWYQACLAHEKLPACTRALLSLYAAYPKWSKKQPSFSAWIDEKVC